MDVQRAWIEHWKDEKVMEQADKAKKNRMTEVDGPGSGPSVHFGGNVPFDERVAKMVCKR